MDRDPRSAGRRRGVLITAVTALAVIPALVIAVVAIAAPADTGPPQVTDRSASEGDVPRSSPDGPPASEPPEPDGRDGSDAGEASETPSDPAVAPLDDAEPTAVRVPAIDVDADVIDLGLHDDGTMEVPPHAPQPESQAGWFTGSPTPGALGPSVITGHVDSRQDGPAVFFDLGALSEGDTIEVDRDDGTTAVFEVQHLEQYTKDEFPTYTVYGDVDHAALRLITCGGDFDSDRMEYDDNIVVYAELVDSHAT